MATKEETGFFKKISISQEHGTLDAYVAETSMVNVENWLTRNSYFGDSLSLIRHFHRVCVIEGVNVDEEHRNQGIGTELLNLALVEANVQGSEIIILAADTGEGNEFDLVRWYLSKRFQIIEGERESYPLMALTRQ
jgi:GNAT superfamily N-acetyltransferase